MSDQDEALLDEDLGDEEYDLGNDEEEALLADDYEIDRQNSYKGEEETDDVLDLGVTDALDDLEGEDENIEYRNDTDNHNHGDFYKEERSMNHVGYYDQEDHEEIRDNNQRYEEGVLQSESGVQNPLNTGDLREKLQKNVQRKVFVGNGQGLEDDDCDEAEERRNRFQNERIMISPKMNNEIPDSLENVVTIEQIRQQPSFRGRGRGRGVRGIRGGRFAAPSSQGSYVPRFNPMRGQHSFNEQKTFRQPLLDGRPPMYPRVPSNNMINQQPLHQQQQQQQQQQQMMYHQNNHQPMPYLQSVPSQPGAPHFGEPRSQFNPNQFAGPQGMPQATRVIGCPRLEYRPRGPMPGPTMQRFNCPPGVPPFMQNQPPHFQAPMLPGNQGPSLLGNPAMPLPGNQGPPGMHGNPGGPPIAVNQGPAMQENPGNVIMPNFPRITGPNQGPPRSSQAPMPNHPPFDQRPNFQDPSLQGRPTYDSRPHYNNQPPPPVVTQMNNATPVSIPPQSGPHVPNMPLASGHKILINPHFRGAVQPSADARLAWDSQQQQQQQPPPQHQPQQPQQLQHPRPGEHFAQSSGPYQNQGPYGQTAPPSQQQQEYQQVHQPVKSDDPYAYFSDVWQENKAQKPQVANKSYPTENNYPRDRGYSSYGNKYGKSENTWEHRDSYQEDQRGSNVGYRERDPPRPRAENIQRRLAPPNNSYHSDTGVEKPSSRLVTTSARPAVRPAAKRSPEMHERTQRPQSPKRVKIMSNRQEFRSTTANESSGVKKEEDMDPEMREYRKKMEEQKRLREQILQEKENRRKQAAMKNNDEEKRGDSRRAGERVHQLETKPVSVVSGVAKDNIHPISPRERSRPANAQATEGSERIPGVRIVRAIQTVESAKSVLENQVAKDTIASAHANERGRQVVGQAGTRRVVIHKPLLNAQKVATSVQKTVSNLERPQPGTRLVQNPVGQVPKGILKKVQVGAGQKIVNTNRTIVKEFPGNIPLRANIKETAPNVIVNMQNNHRVVLQKPTATLKQRAADFKSNTVRIDNLAASTSEVQIRRMCQAIGSLESIHMGEGNATIVFKTQSAATVFHKKYQRKMLDLSLINVHLVQPTSGKQT